MAHLSIDDYRHLLAAEGWFELGNHIEADAELDFIAPRHRSNPSVLKLRWFIYAHAKQWAACCDVGSELCRLAPKDPFGWIHRAHALHELKRTEEAWEILCSVVDEFPADWRIRYDLACYACRLGLFDEAHGWLNEAFLTSGDPKRVKRMALDEPELRPLRKNRK